MQWRAQSEGLETHVVPQKPLSPVLELRTGGYCFQRDVRVFACVQEALQQRPHQPVVQYLQARASTRRWGG